jgi:hypothetical protein
MTTTLANVIALLLSSCLLNHVQSFSTRLPHARLSIATKMASESNEMASLWRDRVEYIDLSSSNAEPSATARNLPLFLLGKLLNNHFIETIK